MIVHPDQAGNDGVAVQVEDLGVGGDGCLRGVADRLDAAVGGDNGLVVACGSAGAVDDFDMSERDRRSVHGDEGFDLGRELGDYESGQRAVQQQRGVCATESPPV